MDDKIIAQDPRESDPPVGTTPPNKGGGFTSTAAPVSPAGKSPEESEPPVSTTPPQKAGSL